MRNTVKHTHIILLQLILVLSIFQTSLFAQPNLPRLQIGDMEYQGAFAIPPNQPDNLSANYSTGTIAYNSANSSLFLSGFANSGIIGEFSIPQLTNTKTNAAALNQATLLQSFRPILGAASTGNPQGINKITGMAVVNGKLIVNAEDYYDAAADNTHTTLVVENPSNIANSAVSGYYSLQGAAHAGGWISTIPSEWQSSLGGSHITGHSSRYSINSRYPMGITAFAFNPSNISGGSGTIPTTTLLDYSLNNPLYAGYSSYQNANYNLITFNGNNTFPGHTAADANVVVGSNNLWTEDSQASYGFIVPGTSTYLTIGSSDGHNSGIGYKPTQNNGYQCAGPCPYDAEDYYNYYWLWDVNDLLEVKNGSKEAHDVFPYDYGVFEELFRTNVNPTPESQQVIVGGTYDANNGILYMSVYDGASVGAYDKLPAIVAYKINGGGNNCPTAGTTCNDNNPNTTNDVEDGSCNCSGTPINPPSGDCELLANTNFDNNTNNWATWGATATSVNGIANITNIITAANPWEVGFSQSNQNISLVQGETYTITFRARADANRPMHLYVGMKDDPYVDYHYETFNLTTTMQEFSRTFTMNSPTDNNINFDFNFGGNTTNAYIDYASLRKANCGGGCDVFDNESFESSWGIWNDGGVDARRNLADAAYANSGSYCARLIDNSGVASSIFTDALDMSAATSVDISFSYIPRSMENNEDFFLEFSNDGVAYAVIGRWIRGRDFENGIRYDETITIDGPFSNNTRFRFRCDASGNGDYIYIDDIIIEACGDVGCPTVGASCNDGNSCTTGSTYDTDCNCVGGNYTDADGDGLCIGEDPNDNDPCNPNPCNDCNVFDNENFDSGWGIWNDGGSDVRRNIGDAAYANSGSYCIRLRDNSGAVSSMQTDALNMNTVTSVDISFSYIPVSMENNEDFFLEFSNDGVAYAVVGRWIRGRDFENGIRYNETITIDGPFSNNTRFRFRCDASGNGDYIYIDDVAIEACGGDISLAKVEVPATSISVNLYPNPANYSIQLDCEISENSQAQMQIYDNVGQLVKNITNIELHEGIQTLNVDVSDLPTGMYFCALQSNEWQTVKKFVIAR